MFLLVSIKNFSKKKSKITKTGKNSVQKNSHVGKNFLFKNVRRGLIDPKKNFGPIRMHESQVTGVESIDFGHFLTWLINLAFLHSDWPKIFVLNRLDHDEYF